MEQLGRFWRCTAPGTNHAFIRHAHDHNIVYVGWSFESAKSSIIMPIKQRHYGKRSAKMRPSFAIVSLPLFLCNTSPESFRALYNKGSTPPVIVYPPHSDGLESYWNSSLHQPLRLLPRPLGRTVLLPAQAPYLARATTVHSIKTKPW